MIEGNIRGFWGAGDILVLALVVGCMHVLSS